MFFFSWQPKKEQFWPCLKKTCGCKVLPCQPNFSEVRKCPTMIRLTKRCWMVSIRSSSASTFSCILCRLCTLEGKLAKKTFKKSKIDLLLFFFRVAIKNFTTHLLEQHSAPCVLCAVVELLDP